MTLRPALTLLLAAYPLAALAVMIAISLRAVRAVQKSGKPYDDATLESFAAQRVTYVHLIFYAVIAIWSVAWLYGSGTGAAQLELRTSGWLSSSLRGAFVGMAWLGLWLLARLLVTNPQMSEREVLGLGAPWPQKIVVWLGGAFAEELWRVTCLVGLIGAGLSLSSSLVVCAIPFALPSLSRGPWRSLLAWIEGMTFGGVFLWLHSFWAPFAAHLAVYGVMLWGVGRYAEERMSHRFAKRGLLKCPACGTSIARSQIDALGPFRCPSCRATLSVSTGYRNALRFTGGLAWLFLFGLSGMMFMGTGTGALGVFATIVFAYGASAAALIAVGALFPLRLQRGDADFIRLDLGERSPPPSNPPRDA